MDKLTGIVKILLMGHLSAGELNRISGQVEMQDVVKKREGTYMRVHLSQVNTLRHLLFGSGVRMRVVGREGLPFLRVKLRRAAPFWVLLVAALLILWGLSQTVMEVKVSGLANQQMERQVLLMMQEMGVHKGAMRQSIDKHGVEEAVLERFSNLTFAALRQRGATLELFVVEATKGPQVFDRNLPVDIVASCAGLVTNVTVLSGTPLVRPGDTVRQGQMLVSGYDEALGTLHANGEVYARLWQTGVGEADLNEEVRVRTGQKNESTTVSFLGFTIPLFLEENPFDSYDLERESGVLLDGLFAPITWEKKICYEVLVSDQPRDIAKVKRQAAQRALTDALNLVPNGARIVDKSLKYSKIKGDKLAATLTLETIAQIGVPVQGK